MKSMYLCVIPLLLPMVHSGETRFVQSCPTSQRDWLLKADGFVCDTSEGLTYHCIMDTKEHLVEACFVPLRISPVKAGCPQVAKYKDNVTYLLYELSNCPSNNSLCPPQNHTGYHTDQLYKYPSCFQKISERFFTDDVITVSTILPRKYMDISEINGYQKEAGHMHTFAVLLKVCVTYICLIFLSYKSKNRHCVTKSGEDFSAVPERQP